LGNAENSIWPNLAELFSSSRVTLIYAKKKGEALTRGYEK